MCAVSLTLRGRPNLLPFRHEGSPFESGGFLDQLSPVVVQRAEDVDHHPAGTQLDIPIVAVGRVVAVRGLEQYTLGAAGLRSR